MNLLGILIVILITIACLAYIVSYIKKTFNKVNSSCEECPYSDACSKKQ